MSLINLILAGVVILLAIDNVRLRMADSNGQIKAVQPDDNDSFKLNALGIESIISIPPKELSNDTDTSNDGEPTD